MNGKNPLCKCLLLEPALALCYLTIKTWNKKIKVKREYRWNNKLLLDVTKHGMMAIFKDWHFCRINLLYQPS